MNQKFKTMYTIFFMLFIGLCLGKFFNLDQNKDLIPVFNDQDNNDTDIIIKSQYDTYYLVFKDYIDIKTYQQIFSFFDNYEYKINRFIINPNKSYLDNVNEAIDNIKIQKFKPEEALNDYLKAYLKVLDNYNLQSEIDSIERNGIQIKAVVITCRNQVINEFLKQHQNTEYQLSIEKEYKKKDY